MNLRWLFPKLLRHMDNKLIITVESFSYRSGIPSTESEHGGGFVFDARCLPNPGREERYKQLTGRDSEVQYYLETCSEARVFLFHVVSIVDLALNQYRKRGYGQLLVQFGCTGGQHRSVYCAEYLRKHLKRSSDVIVTLNHRNLGICEE